MPGVGQLKHSLNNVAQMHTHESRVSGRGTTAVACIEDVLFGNANQADGRLSFVCAGTGDPLGNGSLLNRGTSNASLEQGSKTRLPNVESICCRSFEKKTGYAIDLWKHTEEHIQSERSFSEI